MLKIVTREIQKVKERLIESAQSNSYRVHITPRQNGWAIRKEGNLKATRVVSTQKAAVDLAKQWVKTGNASAIIVHKKNGTFRAAK